MAGRTGRAGKTGVATTFLTLHDSDVFYDLKQVSLAPVVINGGVVHELQSYSQITVYKVLCFESICCTWKCTLVWFLSFQLEQFNASLILCMFLYVMQMLVQSNSSVPPELARHEASKFKPGLWNSCLPHLVLRDLYVLVVCGNLEANQCL